MNKMRPHSIRANAMRIAHRLAILDIEELTPKAKQVDGSLWTRPNLIPDIGKWPFIDLDPLIYDSFDFVLMDDKADAIWPIDYATCWPCHEENLSDWQIHYARSIKPSEARKHGARIFSPKMLQCERVSFREGRFDVGTSQFAFLNRVWVDVQLSSGFNDMAYGRVGHGAKFGSIGNFFTGYALRLRYEWSAIFNFPNGLNLRFGTTAEGALAFFKDRERHDTEIRRAPLLHWVRKHWRRGQTTGEMLRQVRTHMRGREQLIWCGIPVTIIPSEYELETNLVAQRS